MVQQQLLILEISLRCILTCKPQALTVVLAWSVLLNPCSIRPSWEVTPGKMPLGICYRFFCVSGPVGLSTVHRPLNSTPPFSPFSQKGKLAPWESRFPRVGYPRATDRIPAFQSPEQQGTAHTCSGSLLLAETPQQLWDWAVFSWAWVTLAEMSAEPALALSAFAVSRIVNQVLLRDGRCYSWKSSWRNLSISLVQKFNTACGFWGNLLC